MARFIRFVLNHRALVGVGLVLALLLAGYSARSIRFRFQFRDFYDYPQNPHLPLYTKDFEEFGDSAGVLVIMVEAGDVFDSNVLAYIARLTAALETEETFVRIRSLTNVQAIRDRGDEVVTGPLFDPVPKDPAIFGESKRFALDSPLLRRRLIATDGTMTAILAETRTPSTLTNVADQRAAINVIEKALRLNPAPAGVTLRLTGSPLVQVGVTDALIRDQLVLMPGVIAVLGLVLFLTFRSFYSVVLCLSTVSVASIWTAGLFALLQRPIDLIGSLIPTTILVYGVVDPIFVQTRVLQKLALGSQKNLAIVEAFSELGLPCFLTSLTTALGFVAFVTARQFTIRCYGVTVATGVLLAWLTSITVLPLLLSLVPLASTGRSSRSAPRLDAGLRSLWGFLQKRLAKTLIATTVIFALAASLARDQHVDNVYVGELPPGAARDDARRLEQKLAGMLSAIVYLEGKPDAMKEPLVLQKVEAIQTAMRKAPLTTLSSSLGDLVEEANKAFQGGDPSAREVPTSRALVAQYLALIDPTNRSLFVTQDYAHAQIVSLLLDAGSEKTRAAVSELQKLVDQQQFPAIGVKATITGSAVVAYGELDSVVVQLIYGFVVAFGVIVALQLIVFRSLRLAIISVVPNLFPVVCCFLSLRLLRIPLKIDTALVLCISVGGLFNTTIHFAARTRQLAAFGNSEPDEVIGAAMSAVGPPALFTAAALSGGFAVLLLSSFPGLQALGMLSMVTLTIGFCSDMVITPVLLRVGFDWKAAKKRPEPA